MIDFLFRIKRAVILVMLFLLVAGYSAYQSIPKESAPEVPIPVVLVMSTLSGISPEDAERLIVRPLETELSGIDGIKKISSTASEGSASLRLEFDPGFDADTALDDVREAVDRAESDLPSDATAPVVREINTSLFPILSVLVSGDVPERVLMQTSDRLSDAYEQIPGVLEADVSGTREEVLEIQVSREVLAGFDLQLADVVSRIQSNNQLVSAGSLRTEGGDFQLKVPGLVEDISDLLSIPIKEANGHTVSLGDVSEVRQTYKERTSAASFNGAPAVSIEIRKKSGANIIETTAAVRDLSATLLEDLPEGIKIDFMQDESERTLDMLSSLEANVLAAVLLVMIVMLWAMGPTNAFLVGLSIPGAFLAGVLALLMMGYTMNIVVLFALILVVGMLVDGSIVTVEYADKRLSDGASPTVAFKEASKRMAWPIIASTATTLCVFLPLLFWDQTIGHFMKYLPITVILTLCASLAMALVFIPVLGTVLSRKRKPSEEPKDRVPAAYNAALVWSANNPLSVFLLGIVLLAGSAGLYTKAGNGVSFFPSIEPDFLQVSVTNTDGLSWKNRLELMEQVETMLPATPHIDNHYMKVSVDGEAGEVGSIQLELSEWNTRPSADEIASQLRSIYDGLPGTSVEITSPASGPTAAKPIELIAYLQAGADTRAVEKSVVDRMTALGGFTDVTTDLPKAGVEWQIEVDTTKAAQLGADTGLIGQFVQIMTAGVKVSDYRPETSDESVDIVVRLPRDERSFENLHDMRIPTSKGQVPASEFITITPAPATGYIKTIDGRRALSVSADVEPGTLVSERIQALSASLSEESISGIEEIRFAGDAEEQAKSSSFLGLAFIIAVILMFLILLIQFNSFSQTLIVMSAIIFSISGVLLGLIITGRPFMVVMGGIGIISLAGIVVNNNIVLIDAYNEYRHGGMSPIEAAVTAGRSRFRPVMLTSATTILGLLPMVFGLSLDFAGGTTEMGAPATQWWIELSTTIAGGMTFATAITLLFTPALLVGFERISLPRFSLRGFRTRSRA